MFAFCIFLTTEIKVHALPNTHTLTHIHTHTHTHTQVTEKKIQSNPASMDPFFTEFCLLQIRFVCPLKYIRAGFDCTQLVNYT